MILQQISFKFCKIWLFYAENNERKATGCWKNLTNQKKKTKRDMWKTESAKSLVLNTRILCERRECGFPDLYRSAYLLALTE
jgi:hypothetical protein